MRKLGNILSRKWSGWDVREASAPQQPTATGSSVHLPNAVKQIHVNGQHTQQVGRGSLRVAGEPVIVNTKDLEADDIVIASSASGCSTEAVGHGLKSCTDQVRAVKFRDEESGRHVVLVDTPGFDDTFGSDLDTVTLISKWLVSSYNKKKLLSGILFLHRITDNRMAGSSLKSLRMFRKLCGRDVLDKVYLTTAMWDEIELRAGENRLEELITGYWKMMISQGAHVARCRNDDDSPKNLVRHIILSEYGAPPLQPPLVEIRHGRPQRYDIARSGGFIQVAKGSEVVNTMGYVLAVAMSTKDSEKSTGSLDSDSSIRSFYSAHSQISLFEYEQGPSSHPQRSPQRHNKARGGISTSQPSVENRQELPSQPWNVEEPTRTGLDTQPVRQRSVQVTEEPEAMDAPSQEMVDALAITLGFKDSKKSTGSLTSESSIQSFYSIDPQTPQGPSSHPQQSPQEEPTRIGLELTQTVRRGSVQTAQEPEVMNAMGQQAVETMDLEDSGNTTGPRGKALLIQDKITELERELEETPDGRYSQLEPLIEKQLALLRRIGTERKAAPDGATVQELQTEYNNLRAQRNDKLCQMERLKLPWLKRVF